jgi:lipid-A-disaccharide synthase
MRIGIVAGEASGDQLGEGLVQEIKSLYPEAIIEGIAGPGMIEAGCTTLYPMDKLAVMGIVEVLGHLPELLKIRKQLLHHFLDNPPDVFIGIDAPDFNLPLECKLKKSGIKTVHYVSPTVWAWRQKRVHQIKRCVDLMLSIFPFEVDFYKDHDVNVKFVGHPLADTTPLECDQDGSRDALNIDKQAKVLALLPGSRAGEVKRLAEPFLKSAHQCWKDNSELVVIAALANNRVKEIFEQARRLYTPELPIRLIDGKARSVIASADVVLVASGTATLETMLSKKPMVVAYKLSPLTYLLMIKLKMVKIDRYSQPNLLAGKEVVKELIQADATPEKLSGAIKELLDNPRHSQELHDLFTDIHKTLRINANQQSAKAVLNLIGK